MCFHVSFLCVQLRTTFSDISAATAFDVIMDPDYRPTWDDVAVRDYDICKLDGYNDIGYYASKYTYKHVHVSTLLNTCTCV